MNTAEWKTIASGENKIIRFRAYPGFIEIQTVTFVAQDGSLPAARIDVVKLRAEHWSKILAGLKEDRVAEEKRREGKLRAEHWSKVLAGLKEDRVAEEKRREGKPEETPPEEAMAPTRGDP
jgi:hypothetical protein